MNGEEEEVRVGDLYYPGLSLYAIHVSPPVKQDAPGHLQVFTKMTLLCLAGGLSVFKNANPGAIRKYIRRKLRKKTKNKVVMVLEKSYPGGKRCLK